MKKQSILALAIVALISIDLSAQTLDEGLYVDTDEIYRQFELDQALQFPGGASEILNYLNENVSYPISARENAIEGTVRVEFVVMPDGKIQDAKILEGLGFGCDEEVLRVISEMPTWIPGVKDQVRVATKMVMRINFNLTI